MKDILIMNRKEFNESFELLKKLGAHLFQEGRYSLGEGIRTMYYTEGDVYIIRLVFGVAGMNDRVVRRMGKIYELKHEQYCLFSAEDVSPEDEAWTSVLSIECKAKSEVESNYKKIKEAEEKLKIANEKWEREQDEAVDDFLKREGIIT